MDAEALAAEILAVRDDDAARQLVLDAWASADRDFALTCLLGWVREYAAATAPPPAANAAPAGEVRGVKARPAGAPCWWLGAVVTKTRAKPAMGFCAAGEQLPKEARFWAAESQGFWWRLPGRGGP